MMDARLALLLQTVAGEAEILILPHNDPDPDAIASALALRHLLEEKAGVRGRIAYQGIIGRAENQTLVRYLGHPLEQMRGSTLRQAKVPFALVDTQPGVGNNALPPHLAPKLVFDHHPWHEATAAAAFADVRSGLGSTSTLFVEYFQAAGIEPEPPLATALFYGIKTDTLGLIRGADRADVAAYLYLHPLIDVDALIEIERSQVPPEYFTRLDAAMHRAQVYESLLVSYIGPMGRPDVAGEMADLLMRLRGIRWAICMGECRGELVLAVRCQGGRVGAGQLVRAIVDDMGRAGGHGTMAGGQVPLRGESPERLAELLAERALQHLGIPEATAGKPLLG